MSAYVLHRRVKADAWRIGIEANRARKLDSCLWIGWSGQFNLALLSFGKFAKRERTIVEHVRIPYPMLFVIIALGQEPQLVPAVVEPLGRGRWQVLAGELGIDE